MKSMAYASTERVEAVEAKKRQTYQRLTQWQNATYHTASTIDAIEREALANLPKLHAHTQPQRLCVVG